MVKHNSEEFFTYVGQKIAQYRKDSDLTQDQLAQKIGLRQQVLAAYENGTRRIPLPVLLQITVELRINIDDLLPVLATGPRKRGPVPKILRKIELAQSLPEEKQKLIIDLIDSLSEPYNNS